MGNRVLYQSDTPGRGCAVFAGGRGGGTGDGIGGVGCWADPEHEVLRFAKDDNLTEIKRGHASPKIVPFSFARENSKILVVRAGGAPSMNRPLLTEDPPAHTSVQVQPECRAGSFESCHKDVKAVSRS